MTLVLPSPVSNLVLSPGTTNVSRKQHHSTRCKSLIKSRIKTFSLQSFCLPFSIYLRYSGACVVHHRLRVNALATSEVQPQRPATKSGMPTVKNEELVAGATFTGKVRSIQPFGAFVDFGAFTDGLVHLSQLSDIYVKDVRSVVSIGQEVTVKIVEANIETGRIALSMRGIDDITKWQNHNDVPSTSNEPRQGSGSSCGTTNFNPNRDIVQTSSKFFKRGDLQGIVKHLTKVGAFISLPQGQEGFLPTSEESDDGFAYKKSVSALKVGQEVSVHVLRVTKGLITLTMKREQEAEGSNANLVQGVVHAATNPFARAFRKQ